MKAAVKFEYREGKIVRILHMFLAEIQHLAGRFFEKRPVTAYLVLTLAAPLLLLLAVALVALLVSVPYLLLR